MDMNMVVISKIMMIVIFTSFMPFTAWSFYRYRLQRKIGEFDKVAKDLRLTEDDVVVPSPNFETIHSYSGEDYIIPVLFASLLTMMGSLALLLGTELHFANSPNLFLSGVHSLNNKQIIAYQHVSLVTLAMAFMGSFVWSAQNIFRRIMAIDLPPGLYFNIGTRMLLAIFAAVALRHTFGLEASDGKLGNWLPAIALLTGMFPEKVIYYLKDKIDIFSEPSSRSKDLPLSMIEGINTYHKLRLSEVGIDNAQNLASANLIELIVRTPYRPKQLIDWIGQAKLYTYFHNDIESLRNVGIRTIFDYKKLCSSNDGKYNLSTLAQASSIPEEHLKVVADLIKGDINIDRLTKVATKLVAI